MILNSRSFASRAGQFLLEFVGKDLLNFGIWLPLLSLLISRLNLAMLYMYCLMQTFNLPSCNGHPWLQIVCNEALLHSPENLTYTHHLHRRI